MIQERHSEQLLNAAARFFFLKKAYEFRFSLETDRKIMS